MVRSWLLLGLLVQALGDDAGSSTTLGALSRTAGARSSTSPAPSPRELTCAFVPGDTAEKDTVMCDGRAYHLPGAKHRAAEAEEVVPFTDVWWKYIGMSTFCVLCAALAAGLTMGLMSMDEEELNLTTLIDINDIKSESSKLSVKEDQQYARIIAPVISRQFFSELLGKKSCVPDKLDPTNHHYLLVTLLLLNSIANEALPLFLDNVVPAWAAILVSVGFVLVFGEILPSAIFTGPSQMAIAARLCPLVTCMKVVLMPIVWPISLILDKCLGHEAEEGFKRYEMKALVKMITKKQDRSQMVKVKSTAKGHHPDSAEEHTLQEQEQHMLHGVLDLHNKKVDDKTVMQNWETVKAIRLDAVLDETGLAGIMHMNHSRLLVYKHNKDDEDDKRNVVGVVLVKKLVGINPDHGKPVSDIPLRRPLVFQTGTHLLEALNEFQKGHSHIGIISRDADAIRQAWQNSTDYPDIPEAALPIGLITMEDIIEEMVNSEVYDETDRQETLIVLGKKLKIFDKMKGWAQNAKMRVAEQIKREHSHHRLEDTDVSQGQLEHLDSMTSPLLRNQSTDAPASKRRDSDSRVHVSVVT